MSKTKRKTSVRGLIKATLVGLGVSAVTMGAPWVLYNAQINGANSSIPEAVTLDLFRYCKTLYGEHSPGRCLTPNVSLGEVHTSRYGTLNPDFPPDKADNEIRVVAVGGSTTAGNLGWLDSHSYPSELEALLNEAPELDGYFARVINMGIWGQSSEPIRDKFVHDMIPLDPDIVLIYSGWNDFKGCMAFSPEDEQQLVQYLHSGDEAILSGLHPWFIDNVDHWRSQREQRIAELERFIPHREQLFATYMRTGDENPLQELGSWWLQENIQDLREQRSQRSHDVELFLQERAARLVTRVADMDFETFHSVNFDYKRQWWHTCNTSSEFIDEMEQFSQITGVDFPVPPDTFAAIEMNSPYSTLPIERSNYSRNIQEVIDVALQNGVQPIILTVPHGFDCGSAYYHACEGYTASIRDWAAYHNDALQQHLRDMGEQSGVPVVDNFVNFEAMDGKDGRLYKCDFWDEEAVHPNNPGYTKVAEFTFPEVLRQSRIIMQERESR